MKENTLLAWIGNADLRAASNGDRSDIGPIAQAFEHGRYTRLILLCDQSAIQRQRYESWLRQRINKHGPCTLDIKTAKLSSPTNFNDIYLNVTSVLDDYISQAVDLPDLTFHLSPGTPAMAAIWVILGKTRYKATLIQTSKERGVEIAAVPFDISLSSQFVADVLRAPDKALEKLSLGKPEGTAQFGDIIYRSTEMQNLIDRARKGAKRSIPVLIEGESGTGKELLARAIHDGSLRKDKNFEVVNCGAIPNDLVESELFGHEKGAFTGAVNQHLGFFERAHGGTLFLDEIGELPLKAQVKLLRAIQEGEIRRVGATKSIKVDVRIISATNRTLSQEVFEGRFREDLFYRLAVLDLRTPPLREREGDIDPLIDGLLAKINKQSEEAKEPGFIHKKISDDARNILHAHSWPGNIRELENTLRRASVWSDGETISDTVIQKCISPHKKKESEIAHLLNAPLSQPVDIQELISELSKHYIQRALTSTNGNKSKAAALLGLKNYQTLTNWMSKTGIAENWHEFR